MSYVSIGTISFPHTNLGGGREGEQYGGGKAETSE